MTRIRTGFAMLLILLGLAGCGGKPMPFPAPDSEMGPAPGLFTGSSGSFDVPLVKDQPPDATSEPAPAGGPK